MVYTVNTSSFPLIWVMEWHLTSYHLSVSLYVFRYVFTLYLHTFDQSFIICLRAMARMGIFASHNLPSSIQLDQDHWGTIRAWIMIAQHLIHTILLPLSLAPSWDLINTFLCIIHVILSSPRQLLSNNM